MGQWRASEFSRVSDTLWEAMIPVDLAQDGILHYQIIVTDNDDPDGTTCDQIVRTDWYKTELAGSVVPRPSGDICDPCISDLECASEGSLCVEMLGEGFCLAACSDDSDCLEGTSCREVISESGQPGRQCIPVNLDCGQLCFDDATEGESGNEQRATATLVDIGQLDDLSICLGDVDWFRFAIDAGSSLALEMTIHDGGDLGFSAFVPGSTAGPIEALSAGPGVREVIVDCVSEPGEGLVKVWGPGGSEGQYSLSIYEGVGRCGVSCEPDAYDLEQAQDDEPIDIDLPFDEQLSLCPNDQDYFSFRVERGVAYSLTLSPDVADAPMEYVLYRESS